MSICGVGDKECAICEWGKGCLAGVHDDMFDIASKRTLIERLNNNEYLKYRQLMIDTLKNRYDHEYVGHEELPPLPKQKVCCEIVLSKETPKKVIFEIEEVAIRDSLHRIRRCLCPKCNEILGVGNKTEITFAINENFNYCYVCGQRLDWS